MYGNDKNIEKAENMGTKLLVLGFVLQIIGGLCNVLSIMTN